MSGYGLKYRKATVPFATQIAAWQIDPIREVYNPLLSAFCSHEPAITDEVFAIDYSF